VLRSKKVVGVFVRFLQPLAVYNFQVATRG
jgi:hypothetical protein